MSSKSFRGLHGTKHRSSSTAFISLHFNKADEEQLEINYRDKDNSEELRYTQKEENVLEASSAGENDLALNNSPHDSIFDTAVGGASRTSLETEFEDFKGKESRETTPNRDSVVKEYWSKISKRTCSLDSDMGFEKSEEANEGWMFFKDIKGKLTKTLEERKGKESILKPYSKDDKNQIKDKELAIADNMNEENYADPDRTPTDDCDEKRETLKLSPAVEAAEIINENTMFESYINDELARAKCEIITQKDISPSGSQFFSVHSKKLLSKNDCSMTLSSLMATRQPSIEIETSIENKWKDSFEVDKSSPSCTKSQTILNQVIEVPRESIFCKLINIIRRCYYFIKSSWNNVIFHILIAILASLVAPVPSWISGFTVGVILSSTILYWLFKPGKPKKPFYIPDYSLLPPLNIPVSEIEDEPIIYKGWMNELPYDMNYNPDTYHVNCTRSLYVRLDGSYLRFSYPQNNIAKRAMFNEPRHDMQFIYQQHYDITGASVELLPEGLARRRLWSKKYPICLRIPNPKQAVLSSSLKDNSDENLSKSVNRRESPLKKFVPRINENNEVVIYLFSRTDREKDLWYNRFKNASKIKMLTSHSPSSSPNIAAIDTSGLENKRTISIDLSSLQLCSSYDTVDSLKKESDEIDSFVDIHMTKQQKFELYMSHLLTSLHFDHSLSFSSMSKDKKDGESKLSKLGSLGQNNLTWLNVLLGRIFFDFLSEEVWADCVAKRIQKKISKIKLPVFLTELIVKDINLGTALPKIHRASEPSIDQRGLWVDIDLSYNGSFQMTLETKLNLLRYKSDSEGLSLSSAPKENENPEQPIRSPVYNSEEEDSAESSSDEDIPLPEVNVGSTLEESVSQAAGGSTSKKILRFVDRLAQSPYFQHAAKNKYIKRAMEDISNTPLVLTVEVQWLTGTLALNIPPMPSDRIWYGFRTNPFLSIVARPKLGQHVVTFTHVTEWIERKLVSEFQKVLVMPNMDDLIIPIMQSDHDLPKA